MALLTAFPIELLLHVFSYLDRVDFLALSSTHALLRGVSQPLLYREIKGTWYDSEPKNPPIYLLLRTLAGRPDLGAQVEHLILEGEPQRRNLLSESEDAISFRRDDRSPLIELMYQLQVSPLEEWIRLLDVGSMDVFVALLLSRLSNLKYLSLGYHFQFNVPCTMAVLRKGLIPLKSKDARSQITFEELREVSFCQDIIDLRHLSLSTMLPGRATASNPIYCDDLEPLLFSKAIRKLTMWLQNEPDLRWSGQRSSPSNLRVLILHHSHAGEHTLEDLLSQLQGLEILEYHYHGYTKTGPERSVRCPLDCTILSEALDQVKDTIKRLKISAHSNQSFEHQSRPDWAISGHLKSFGKYRHLQSLTVPLVMFLGWSSTMSEAEIAHALPVSLEQLCLTDDFFSVDGRFWKSTDYLAHFRDYRHKWRQHASSLKHLSKTVDCVMSWRWGHMEKQRAPWRPPQHVICAAAEHQEELRQLCESVNMKLYVQGTMETRSELYREPTTSPALAPFHGCIPYDREL
ncbi:hypothetical protein MMC13_003438 [Lambiella insularis]|nr:hypothetical protein [Lambiella insularis]